MEASAAPRSRGVIYTFYSFKGGVGRSMALANAAALLSKSGKSVLIIDWDLEAPGIEKFFEKWTARSRRDTAGLVDIITDFGSGSPRDWHECLLKVKLPKHSQEIHVISAGQDDPRETKVNYGKRLQQIKWDTLFDEQRFGGYLERLRREWTAEYDFVLVDSRTGITDIGGICTIHLPDVLVCLFTTTEQSLQGVKDVMERAAELHASLPVDRKKLMIVPLPARDESRTEYNLAKEWRERFARELATFYKDWAPRGEEAIKILDLLKIPYVAFWSFGERLPVLEEDVNNPDKLAYFYQLLVRLMVGKLDLQEVKQGTKTTEAVEAQQAEAAKAAAEAAAQRVKAQQEAAAAERDKQSSWRRARKERYEQYLTERVRPIIATYTRMTSLFFGIAIVLGVAFLGGAIAVAPDISGNDRVRSIFTWVALGAVAVVALLIHLSRQYRRKANDLRVHQAVFEATMETDEGLQSLPEFIESAEGIIARSALQPIGPREAAQASAPPTSRPPDQSPTAPSPSSPPGALGRDVPAPPRAKFRKKESVDLAMPLPSSEPVRFHDMPSGGYDVFVSARHDPFINTWRKEFVPLLQSWVSDLVGRDISIFTDEQLQPGSAFAESIQSALRESTCLLAIVTPAYFQSSWARSEWDAFAASRPDAIVPVLLRGPNDSLPLDARRFKMFDFTNYSFVGEGFQKTQAYVEFQGEIRRVAERVAEIINSKQPATPVTS